MLRLPVAARAVGQAVGQGAETQTGPSPPPMDLRPPPPPASGAPPPSPATSASCGLDAAQWHEESSRPSSTDYGAVGSARSPSPDPVGPAPGQFSDDFPRRPVAPDGRPVTRRTKEAMLAEAQAGGAERTIRGRRVVYVDHHHVHHHHHFHPASEVGNGSPGDVPPEADRKDLELRAEEDAERVRAHAARSKASDSHSARSRDGSLRKVGSYRGRTPRSREATAGSRSLTSASSSRGQLKSASTSLTAGFWPPDTEFTAESLFCRDSGAPWTGSTTASTFGGVSVGGTSLGETSVHTTIGTGKPKQLLSLSEYLSLISQLTPETRLKFSPYGVPRSARAMNALSASGVVEDDY